MARSDAWAQEIFGPVLCVAPFETEAEAVTLANDSEYGLAAAVFSADVGRCARVAAALRAGVVWQNCSQVRSRVCVRACVRSRARAWAVLLGRGRVRYLAWACVCA